MNMQNSKSKQLLDKVYNHLGGIDISKLSLRELEDFLGVVQKGQFLEATGQIPPYGFGGWGLNRPAEPSGDSADKAE